MTSFKDWVVETSSTTGTGSYSLSGSPPAGTSYFTFRQRYSNGETEVCYWVVNADRTKWEKNRFCTLTYGTPDALARGVVESTNGDAPVSWVSGDLPLRLYVVPDADAEEFAISMGFTSAARPDVLKYGIWSDEDGISADVDELNFFDGVSDIPFAKIDRTAHTFDLLSGVDDVVFQFFTADGTYTPNPKMLFCEVIAVGGGGGGGGASVGGAGFVTSAGGGGAGGYSFKRLTAADIGASKAVVIGAGGASTIAGGDTYLGASLGAALCAARGGGAGASASAGGSGTGGSGSGTTGAVGDLKVGGSGGQSGFYATIITVGASTTQGGTGPFGGGCLTTNVANSNGGAGEGYGSGGGGAYGYNSAATLSGGSGAGGIMIIREFLKP